MFNKFFQLTIIRFKRPEEARKALLKINGLRLHNDYRIKVGLWNEAKAMEPIEHTEAELDGMFMKLLVTNRTS
jgi:hypothetical protein